MFCSALNTVLSANIGAAFTSAITTYKAVSTHSKTSRSSIIMIILFYKVAHRKQKALSQTYVCICTILYCSNTSRVVCTVLDLLHIRPHLTENLILNGCIATASTIVCASIKSILWSYYASQGTFTTCLMSVLKKCYVLHKQFCYSQNDALDMHSEC